MKSLMIGFIFLFWNCTNSKDSAETKANGVVEIKNSDLTQSQPLGDSGIYQIDGRSVVFYMPSQEEFDSILVKSDNDIEINELYTDFYSYAELMSKRISKAGLKSEVVYNKVFKIKSEKEVITYKRTSNKKGFGVIISDGSKRPFIMEGKVLKEKECATIIKNYFGISL